MEFDTKEWFDLFLKSDSIFLKLDDHSFKFFYVFGNHVFNVFVLKAWYCGTPWN